MLTAFDRSRWLLLCLTFSLIEARGRGGPDDIGTTTSNPCDLCVAVHNKSDTCVPLAAMNDRVEKDPEIEKYSITIMSVLALISVLIVSCFYSLEIYANDALAPDEMLHTDYRPSNKKKM